MERDIVYDSKEKPHVESNFEIILRLMYKVAKAMSSVAQMIFQPGFDNKTIIKK